MAASHRIIMVSVLLAGLSLEACRQRKVATEMKVSEGAESNSESKKIDLGRKVNILCFFGPNDHDKLVERHCPFMFKQCSDRYKEGTCVQQNNLTPVEIANIPKDEINVIVTHSTPPHKESSQGEPISLDGEYVFDTSDEAEVEIWDTEVRTKDIGDSKVPTIWYGCFGAQVSAQYPNIIALEDERRILDTSLHGDQIHCRFKATFLCIEQYIRQRKPINRSIGKYCVNKLVEKHCPQEK